MPTRSFSFDLWFVLVRLAGDVRGVLAGRPAPGDRLDGQDGEAVALLQRPMRRNLRAGLRFPTIQTNENWRGEPSQGFDTGMGRRVLQTWRKVGHSGPVYTAFFSPDGLVLSRCGFVGHCLVNARMQSPDRIPRSNRQDLGHDDPCLNKRQRTFKLSFSHASFGDSMQRAHMSVP